MTARHDNTAAQLVAGHVKPLAKTSTTYASGADAVVPSDAIAAEAYALWAERGHQDGHDVENWLEAERRLRNAAGTNGDTSGIR